MIIRKKDDFFLIKIYKEFMGDFDIFDKNSIKEFFQDVFQKLKQKYDISGLIDVDVYVNSSYGMIIEVHPICDYFDEVDMRIQIHLGSIFLNEIGMDELIDYEDVYYYKDKFYGIYQGINDSEVLYKDIEDIIEKGIKVC